MAQNKFKAYMEGRQWSDNLRDFVDHAVDDPNLPDAETWEQLRVYLNKQPYIIGKTLSAAEYVWQRYEADVLKKAG